ncbi:MAG: hypothetical protein ACREBE_25490 [bacterium]
MNHVVARIAGAFSDAMDERTVVHAPIFEHRDFEHLETGDE